METIQRRKVSQTAEIASSSPSVTTTETGKDSFSNSNALAASLVLPFFILLAFGGKLDCFPYNIYVIIDLLSIGRASFLIVSFGAIVCYIFDLLGAIEATLLSIFVTLITLWMSLVYAARFLLQTSLLNLSMTGVFGFVVLYIFLVLSGYFHSIRISFEGAFVIIEKILFTTLPLISSTIITWFFCLEVPVLDLSLCFSTVYFIHIYFLGQPRSSSLSSIYQNSNYILNNKIITQLYVLPIIISFILYVALHHNVLSSTFNMLNNLLICVLLPSILVTICIEHHINYWSDRVQLKMIQYCHIAKTVAVFLLLICLQNHSFFYDLKIYSGYREPYASLIFVNTIIGTISAIYIHENYTQPYLQEMKEDITQSRDSNLGRKLFYADIAENISIILATLSIGMLLRLPSILFVFCVLCIRINVFFTRSSLRNRYLARTIFITAASITAFAVSLTFTTNTLGIATIVSFPVYLLPRIYPTRVPGVLEFIHGAIQLDFFYAYRVLHLRSCSSSPAE